MTDLRTHRYTSDELLRAIDHLDVAELRPFLSSVLARTARRLAPHLEARESELLEQINRTLPSQAEERYQELIKIRQAEALTPAELEELLSLTEQDEALQAERAKHLADLARVREVPLSDLMTELGIEPISVE